MNKNAPQARSKIYLLSTFFNFEFVQRTRFCGESLTSCQKRYFGFAKIRNQLMNKEAHQLMAGYFPFSRPLKLLQPIFKFR